MKAFLRSLFASITLGIMSVYSGDSSGSEISANPRKFDNKQVSLEAVQYKLETTSSSGGIYLYSVLFSDSQVGAANWLLVAVKAEDNEAFKNSYSHLPKPSRTLSGIFNYDRSTKDGWILWDGKP